MNIQNRPMPSIQQVQNEHLKTKKVNPNRKSDIKSFDNIFKQTIQQNQEVKFSKHANLRLSSRNINITKEQMQKINQGIINAGQKGIKESLVLVDDIALVVNVENKTVVTALDKKESKEHIFTNIDGAVIL